MPGHARHPVVAKIPGGLTMTSFSTRLPTLRHVFLSAILLAGVAGCGGVKRVPCYPVHGEVFVGQGKDRVAATGASVTFHPTTPAGADVPRPHAQVGDDGKFVVTTFVKDDGAPAGDYTITITWVPPKPRPPFKPKEVGDKLKGEYGDPKKADINYSVEARKDNKVPPIELP
jgi:hypothetical protein